MYVARIIEALSKEVVNCVAMSRPILAQGVIADEVYFFHLVFMSHCLLMSLFERQCKVIDPSG